MQLHHIIDLPSLFCLLCLQIWRIHLYKHLMTCLTLAMTWLDLLNFHSNLGLAWDLKVKTWDLLMTCMYVTYSHLCQLQTLQWESLRRPALIWKSTLLIWTSQESHWEPFQCSDTPQDQLYKHFFVSKKWIAVVSLPQSGRKSPKIKSATN